MDTNVNTVTQLNPDHMLAEAARNACVILHVRCTKFGLERTDRKASKEMNQAHGAVNGAGRAVINRLAGAQFLHDQIDAVQKAIRANAEHYTMPWGNDGKGSRLLPNGNLGKWAVQHKRLLGEFKGLLDKLRAEADRIISEAKANRGNYEIPAFSTDELVGSYTVDHRVEPVPSTAGFAKLDEGIRNAFSRDLELRIAARVTEAKDDSAAQMKALIEHMVGRFQERIEHEEKKAKGTTSRKAPQLYESTITNIQDLAQVWDSFNITKDPKMAELSKKFQRLTQVDIEAVKTNTDVAEAAIADGKEILADLNDLLIPGFNR